ncbi:Methionyl-tRNA formyltransferase [Polyrhizophydium stewartii]|uniref:methionyl-tRNA formyltransferase n=1 Tax=Polyrhizophydium stewartii TaxID=2732419 RepID=A0ABR4MVJ7_9FUNG
MALQRLALQRLALQRLALRRLALHRYLSTTPRRLRPHDVLFFGSDHFSIRCIEELLARRDSLLKTIRVVTPPDNLGAKHPSQRQVPLKVFCAERGIESTDAPPKSLRNWSVPTLPDGRPFDVAVVVSFGYFLPRRVVQAFPTAAVNVHPSLLPKYRGASPIQYAVLNGDDKTGVSIIELSTDKFDAGRILKQSVVPIPKNVYFDELHDTLAAQGAVDLADVLADIEAFRQNAADQDESLVTKAPRFEKHDAYIQWHTQPKGLIYALHRAIGSRIPLITKFRGKLCQVRELDCPLTPMQEQLLGLPSSPVPPGALFFSKAQKTLFARCVDGWLGVRAVRVEGKRDQDADSFNNGYQIQNFRDCFESLPKP